MADKNKVALFILRLGIGIFLMLWGFDKIFAPDKTMKIFQHFYKASISLNMAYAFGIIEIILALAIIAGLWKKWTYGAGLLINAVSVLSSWKQLINPFGENHLFIAGIVVLASMIALYLMREEDTFWTWKDLKG